MGVATSEQAYRAVTQANRDRCQCYELSTLALSSTTPLPTAADHPTLSTTVKTLLRCLRVAQPIRMDAHRVDDFWFDDVVDRTLVDSVRQTGTANAATHRILEASLTLDPRATAESLVDQNWPLPIPDDPADASAPAQLPIVPTPPVGLAETVETAVEDL